MALVVMEIALVLVGVALRVMGNALILMGTMHQFCFLRLRKLQLQIILW